MKTIFGKSIMGALAIASAFGITACGAETGAPGESAIGETSEALSASPTAQTSLSSTQKADFSSACAFYDGTDYYIAKAGGFDPSGSGTPLSAIHLLKRAAGSWTTQTATLQAARGQAQSYQIDALNCVVVGGQNNIDGAATAASAKVDLLTLDTSVTPRVVLRTSLHDLQAARGQFKLSECIDSNNAKHLVAVAGKDANLATPELRDVEVSPTFANITNAANAWTRTTGVFGAGAGRYDFGMDTNFARGYVIAGGTKAGGRTNEIRLLTLDSSCANPALTVPATQPALTASIEGNAVIFDTSTSKFMVAAGRSGANTLWHDANLLTVSFSGTPDVTGIASSTPNVDMYRPELVRKTGANAVVLFGGSDTAASPASLTKITEYPSWPTATLAAGIYGGSGVYLGGSVLGGTADEAWIMSGDSTPGTLGTAVASITP